MFKQILILINWMLLFAAASILVLGSINSIFGTNLGMKIGGHRFDLPEEFIAVFAISMILVCFAGLLSLALYFGPIVAWIKAEPLMVGGGIFASFIAFVIVGYSGMVQLAGGPLTFAVEQSDHAAVVEILKTETYSQQALDAQLYQAVANGDYDIAQTLIDFGADVNHKFGEFESPLLHAAVLWHEVNASNFLLAQGADPNQVDNLGRTPLLETVFYRASPYSNAGPEAATEIAIALMAAGANPSLAANNGDTPISIAEKNKHQKIHAEILQRLTQ